MKFLLSVDVMKFFMAVWCDKKNVFETENCDNFLNKNPKAQFPSFAFF